MTSMSKLSALTLIEKISSISETFFWGTWQVCLVALISTIVAEQGLKAVKTEYNNLYQQYVLLQNEKETAISMRDNLKLQINSQSDPAWVELTLKKGLGLVPEGQTKILFNN